MAWFPVKTSMVNLSLTSRDRATSDIAASFNPVLPAPRFCPRPRLVSEELTCRVRQR